MKRLLLPGLITIAVCGCHDRNNPNSWLDGQVHEQRPAGWPVEVFYGERKPTRPFKEIRLLRFQTPKNGDKTVQILRSRTRESGGDACIVGAKGNHSEQGEVIFGFGGGGEGGDVTEALVIVYTDQPVRKPGLVE